MHSLSAADVQALSDRHALGITGDEASGFAWVTNQYLEALGDLCADADEVPDITRTDRQVLPVGEDPYNALVRRCDVIGNPEGTELGGVRVAVKDNISVAGIPMTAGSSFLSGHVPKKDALVVERLTGAGASIVATTNMDALAFSAGGETSDYGVILNPFDPARTAGGSSGGSAAALWYSDIDVSLGTDQGGSVRIPASWCGVLGLKPTHGAVPYAGALGAHESLDHIGPLARSVSDLRSVFQVIADSGPFVKTSSGPVESQTPLVRDLLERTDLRDVRFGVLAEGIEDGCAPEVARAFGETVARLRSLGAQVTTVSVPAVRRVRPLIVATLVLGIGETILGGLGTAHRTGYDPDLDAALARVAATRASHLPASVKAAAMVRAHLQQCGPDIFGRAQNERDALRSDLNTVLGEYEFLLLPTTRTTAMTAMDSAGVAERFARGRAVMANTAVFNLSGHPALSMPAASAHGLPVGVQIVGRKFSDYDLLNMAAVYEANFGWEPQFDTDIGTAGLR